MRELTFKSYAVDEGDPPPVGPDSWFVAEIPLDVVRDRPGGLPPSLTALGFDRNNIRIGYLSAQWKGHPPQALVIAESINLTKGKVFAVSNEPGPASGEARQA